MKDSEVIDLIEGEAGPCLTCFEQKADVKVHSRFGPYIQPKCTECLDQNAEPIWLIDQIVQWAGGPALVDRKVRETVKWFKRTQRGRGGRYLRFQTRYRVKTILLDFDGTINSYVSGFTGPTDLPDPPLPGGIEFLQMLLDHPVYDPVIFTTRAWQGHGDEDFDAKIRAIKDWFIRYGIAKAQAETLLITAEKRLAKLIIDDNCFRFVGTYPTLDELDGLVSHVDQPIGEHG